MSNCQLPVFSFAFSLPAFSFRLPSIPTITISLSIPCPLD